MQTRRSVGLGQEHGVREHAGAHAGEGAVARALLLDRAHHREVGAWAPGGGQQGLDRQGRHRQAALHVARAAPLQPPVDARRGEGRGRPGARVVGGDDVQVPVDQQRGARVRRPAGEPRDEDLAIVVGEGGHAGRRVVADGGGDVEPRDLEAEAIELSGQHRLRRALVSEHARSVDELREQVVSPFLVREDRLIQARSERDLGQTMVHSPNLHAHAVRCQVASPDSPSTV